MLLAEDLRPAPASENYLDTLTKLYYKVLKTYNRNIELDPSVQADTQLDLHLLLWDIAGCVMDRQALIGIPDHILTLDQKQARKEALEEITAVEEVLTKRAETLLALITQAVNAQEAVGGKNAIIQAAHERAKALRDETHPGIAGPLLETYTQTILGLSGQKAANKSLTATDETAQ
jgi:hypothetical protein